MDIKEREQLTAQYKDGYRVVAEALLNATPEELDAHPAPGAWSAREIVHHLADSEMIASVRFRMLLGEDHTRIVWYEQDDLARRLHYDRPHELSLDLFKAVRASTVELMCKLTEAEWQREGVDSQNQRYGLDTWLMIYAPHAHRHAQQILAAMASAAKTA